MINPLRDIPKTVWFSVFLFLSFSAQSIYLRPLLPNAETRYITVAWNMWLSGNHLVPFIDGAPYSDKPPLLFIFIKNAWDLFGPSETVARMVPALIASISFVLVYFIARALWPGEKQVASMSPLILISFVAFVLFAHTLMFDGTLTVFVLIGILGVIYAARGHMPAGFFALMVATTFGLLTKGPVYFVPIAVVGVFYPYWRPPDSKCSLKQWYAGFICALIIGCLVPILWAYLAVSAAGKTYGYDLLWHQTAGRLVHAIAHQKPWWYYLAYSPAILFPWFYWTELSNKATWKVLIGEWQGRLLIVWSVVSLIVFSAISGKRILYLLPIFPAFALIISRMLTVSRKQTQGKFLAWIPPLIIGLCLCIATFFGDRFVIPKEVPVDVSTWFGPSFFIVSAVFFFSAYRSHFGKATLAAVCSIMILTATLSGISRILREYDPINIISQLPEAGSVPLAVFGGHHGQFGFSARREKKVNALFSVKDIRNWSAANPNGYLLSPAKRAQKNGFLKPHTKVRYKGDVWGIWNSKSLFAAPIKISE